MANTVQISVSEYEVLKEAVSLLKDNEFMKKMNRLVELMYEERYGLYLGDDTTDLTVTAIQKANQESTHAWDDV